MKTDSQLQHDVNQELKWEPSVHETQIGVEVKGGVVTLSGEVGTYAEKIYAERAAQRVIGVNALAVDLKVHLSGPASRTDADIAGAAENLLNWTTSSTGTPVKVMVEHGFITLTGEVQWQYQKQAAAEVVCHLLGVIGVSNQIALKPALTLSAVKADIESALKRTAASDAKKIHVEVHGAEVTLSGTVQSWAERETATTSAWSTPGVVKVIDNLVLAF